MLLYLIIARIFLFLDILHPKSLALPQMLKPNVREACRQELAGAYIKSYDDRERLRTFLRALDDQKKDVTKALLEAQKKQTTIETMVQSKEFDLKLIRNADEAAIVVRNYRSQSQWIEEQLISNKVFYDLAVKEEARLKMELSKIFVVNRLNDRPDGGYPIELTYKSPCPKYRSLCSLPRNEAEILRKINIMRLPTNNNPSDSKDRSAPLESKETLQVPESCLHYASQGLHTPP